jgi:hypothetical protein
MNLHINHPRVIATARRHGITELQALRYERGRDILRRRYARDPKLILIEPR